MLFLHPQRFINVQKRLIFFLNALLLFNIFKKFFAYVKTIHNLQLLKDEIEMKNDWRDKYIESIRKISEIIQKQRQRSLSPCFSRTQSPRSQTSTPKNKSYRRERVTSFIESKPDLSSLDVLEKLERRYSNILKIKKALDFKTDRQRCDENTMFLNSLFEDRKKQFVIVTKQERGNVKKLIGVVRDIFPKRGKSLIQKNEKSESRKKNVRSLSIDRTLKRRPSEEVVPIFNKQPEFINGRKLKNRLFKILRLKTFDSTLLCQGTGYLENSNFSS